MSQALYFKTEININICKVFFLDFHIRIFNSEQTV